MSEYEPGTVAAIRTSVLADDGGVAVRVKKYVLTDEPVWMWLTNGGVPRADGGFVRDKNVTDVRPLVVLDPDFPRTVVKHLRAAYNQHSELTTLGWLADQIEAQTRPPKPPEPQGLGAVVEDAEGVTWVRVNVKTGTAEWRSTPHVPEHRRYRAIAAVRVLSEGVTDA